MFTPAMITTNAAATKSMPNLRCEQKVRRREKITWITDGSSWHVVLAGDLNAIPNRCDVHAQYSSAVGAKPRTSCGGE